MVISDITFSSQINGGQGELVLRIADVFASSILAVSQIVKVYESDANHTDRLIYAGIVGSIVRTMDEKGEYIEARCLGLASIMTWLYTCTGAGCTNPNWSNSGPNWGCLETIWSSLAYFYPFFTANFFDDGTSSTISFSYTRVADAIQNVISMQGAGRPTGLFWYCGADAVVYSYLNYTLTGSVRVPPSGRTIQTPTIGREIESIVVEENGENIVNNYHVDGSGYASGSYNGGSVTANGQRDLHESRTDLSTQASLDNLAYVKIWSLESIKQRVTIVINSNYDIESVLPGDLLTVQNSEYGITALQIQKIDYTPDRITCQLEQISSFSQEILGSF